MHQHYITSAKLHMAKYYKLLCNEIKNVKNSRALHNESKKVNI